jgi:hypothetical protein
MVCNRKYLAILSSQFFGLIAPKIKLLLISAYKMIWSQSFHVHFFIINAIIAVLFFLFMYIRIWMN